MGWKSTQESQAREEEALYTLCKDIFQLVAQTYVPETVAKFIPNTPARKVSGKNMVATNDRMTCVFIANLITFIDRRGHEEK